MWADEYSDSTNLSRAECLEHLSLVSLGRIGASIDALPVILPVHFVVSGESVLFHTVPGTKLDAATIGAVVAFQADDQEPLNGSYWSVLLQGIASLVSDTTRQAQERVDPMKSAPGVQRELRLVQIQATNVSGRKFRIAGEVPTVELPDAPSL
jgi:nitroimidazol reductase NimA-like FMN-containing flavoprotein (pyridoxamine 5'-phosphate oxidase superfamily)